MKGYCGRCEVKFDETNCRKSVLKIGKGNCRSCHNSYMRSYNSENKDEVKRKNNQNYLKNAERYRGYRRKYYATHREECSVWFKKHRGTSRGRHTQVKEVLRKEEVHSTDALWSLNYYAELVRDGECHYCLGPLNKSGHALDRMNNSEPHTCWNVVPACWWCNERKKADLSYEEMMLLVPALREIRRRRELKS